MRRGVLAVLCAVVLGGSGLAPAAQATTAPAARATVETVASSTVVTGGNAGGTLPTTPVAPSAGVDPVPTDAAAGAAAPVTEAAAALPSTRGPGFMPVSPVRVMDTRRGLGGVTGPLTPGRAVPLALGTRLTGALRTPVAVVLNVTLTSATSNGYVSLYPGGTARPSTSSVNVTKGRTVANSVTVGLGAGSTVTVYSAADVQVLVDLLGYYESGGGYTPVTPTRFLNTLAVSGSTGVLTGQTVTAQLRGRYGVPAGATAVAVNITVLPTTTGYVTAFAGGASRPSTTSVSVPDRASIATAAYVPLGADGSISLYNGAGATALLGDVVGWFDSTRAYVPVAPWRALDSRQQSWRSLDPGFHVDLKLTGARGVADVNVTGVVMTVTATRMAGSGWLGVGPWRLDGAEPSTSSINFNARETATNLVVSKVGPDGTVRVYNGSASSTAVIVDVVGFYTSDARPTYALGAGARGNLSLSGLVSNYPNDPPCDPAVSNDGRYIAFVSSSPDLVPYPAGYGLYVRDVSLGVTSAIAYSSTSPDMCPVSMSTNGRWLLWESVQQWLPRDLNSARDLFASDLWGGGFVQISWNFRSDQAPRGGALGGGMSSDARYFVYASTDDTLVASDPNTATPDVFLVDTEAGAGPPAVTRVAAGRVSAQPVSLVNAATGRPRVVLDATAAVTATPGYTGPVAWDGTTFVPLNVSTTGTTTSAPAATSPMVSADGRRAAFTTTTRLAPSDRRTTDVYVRDLGARTTTLVDEGAPFDEVSAVSGLDPAGRTLTYRNGTVGGRVYRWLDGVGVAAAANDPYYTGGSQGLLSPNGAFLAWTTLTGPIVKRVS